jgi:heme-degrading monooxygenase HmoA
MHIQIVSFNLKDMSESEYQQMCEGAAPAFASLPGLLSKVWISDQAANTYGGVYTWRDRQSMEGYLRSDLFKAISTNPHLANLNSRDYSVLETPTRATRGFVA